MIYTLQATTFGTSAAVAMTLAFLSPPVAPTVAPTIAIERSEYGQANASGVLAGSHAGVSNFDALAPEEPPTAAPAILAGNPDTVTLDVERQTTARERAIGELRSWTLLPANWDSEGAAVPKIASLKEAWTFLCLLTPDAPIPEPMLLASGRAGLYWNDGTLYADLEFTGDGQITYYIEQRGKGKHKGAVVFDGNSLPPVFSALLSI